MDTLFKWCRRFKYGIASVCSNKINSFCPQIFHLVSFACKMIVVYRNMFVHLVLLPSLLINCVWAQLSFDLPIEDTTKFNHAYDFIVIGAGTG